MYRICYILSDEGKLYYYNQLLISLISLQKYNPNRNVIVLLDDSTADVIREFNRTELIEWNIETKIIKLDQHYNAKERSRFLKTTFREQIKGDVLYVDTDTVFSGHLPELVSEKPLALVLDLNKEISIIDEYQENRLSKIYAKCGYQYESNTPYYNSGVIWARDCDEARRFFQKWHVEWVKCRNSGVLLDQPSLNYVNSISNYIIEELDGKWNVQVSCVYSFQYLKDALIIHYYNTEWERMRAIFYLSDPEIQSQGYQGDKVRKILSSPKTSFAPCTFLRRDEIVDELMYSNAFKALRTLYKKHFAVYRCLNFFLSLPGRIRQWRKK